MSNPHKKFEIELAPVGVWFSELDEHGNLLPVSALYISNEDLNMDVNELTKTLQVWFNF